MPSNTEHDIVLADNWIYLDRRAIEVAKWIDKTGSRISNMWKKFPRTHGSRDTAHEQWLWWPRADIATTGGRICERGKF